MGTQVVILTGNLGKDAEMRFTPTGTPILNFSLPIDIGFGEKKETMWVRCAMFGERAQKLAEHLTKGKGVQVVGEYALYCDGKVVGLVCDDTLYVKITDEGKKFVGKYYEEGYAYNGAKVSIKIDEDHIDDREWLSELIEITASHLPMPKKKKKKGKKTI